MNNRKFKYIIESDEEILGINPIDRFQTLTLEPEDETISLHESEKIILWRGSEEDLATDIGEFLCETQIQDLILELSSEYQKKKRERLGSER